MDIKEAKDFITKAVKEWEASETVSDNQKIISLAEFAQRWYNPDGGHKARATTMLKDINALKLLITRGTKRGEAVKVYEDQLKSLQSEFDELVAKHKITFEPKKKKKTEE